MRFPLGSDGHFWDSAAAFRTNFPAPGDADAHPAAAGYRWVFIPQNLASVGRRRPADGPNRDPAHPSLRFCCTRGMKLTPRREPSCEGLLLWLRGSRVGKRQRGDSLTDHQVTLSSRTVSGKKRKEKLTAGQSPDSSRAYLEYWNI